MPRPDYYKTVIARAIERYKESNIDSMEFADLILISLDQADDLMGFPVLGGPTGPMKSYPLSNILIKMPSGQATSKLDTGKALLIGTPPNQLNAEIIEEAPPTAVVRNPDGMTASDTPEEIEQKKSVLHSWILGNLPQSMTLKLPGFEKAIQLNLYVRPSPVKMNFIRIFYTQFAEEEDGPQLQLSIEDKDLDATAIKTEIVRQAEMRYQATKRKVEARIPPPNPQPDLDAAFRNAKYDPASDIVSDEDRELWNKSAGRQVI